MAKKDLVGQYFGKLLVKQDSGKRASNGGIIWTCQCECGNIVDIPGNNLTRKKYGQISCGKCIKAEDLTGQKFGKLTAIENTGKKINGKYVWKCLCDCGNYTEVHSANLKNGSVKSCGCLHSQKTDLTGQKFGKLVALSYNKQKAKWLCQCDCGNITFVSSSNLNSGGTQSCGCSHFSLGEEKVQQALDNLQITYEKQKSFDSCRFEDTNYLARFDFYLPKEDVLIEYDGEQHFHPVEFFGGEEAFNTIQKRDKLKTNWCIENGKRLLRIPYFTQNVEEKIKCFLEEQ